MSVISFEDSNANLMDTSAYKSTEFNSQYTGATKVGLIRGAYHFARPDVSSGAVQAKYFLANGGWYRFRGFLKYSAASYQVAGPAMVSPYLERLTSNVSTFCVTSVLSQIDSLDNPYGKTCYGLSASAMVSWIQDFSNTYHSATKR